MEEKRSVIIFGASGMVGKGVLLECLESNRIKKVMVVGRNPCGITNPKLKEILHKDFSDLSSIHREFEGFEACFFTLGVSVIGLNEQQYTRITYDFTIEAAKTMKEANPNSIFIYVTGQGTDSSESGGSMWARVKGKTENALLDMGFRDAYMFRPGYIQPMKGVRSKVWWYQAIYDVFGVFYPIIKRVAKYSVTSTGKIGRAMINLLFYPYQEKIINPKDINLLAEKN